MQTAIRRRSPFALISARMLAFLAVLGPGFITANVDNDPGGILTYSQAGAQFGYQLLWTLIPTTIALIVVQEMAARMGAITGKGLSDLIREEFGLRATFFTMVVLGLADFFNIVSEFAGLASGMGIFGISKYIVVPLGAALVWGLIVRGRYKPVERILIVASLMYFAYPVSAFLAKPNWDLAIKQTFIPVFQQRSGVCGDDCRADRHHHHAVDAVLSSGGGGRERDRQAQLRHLPAGRDYRLHHHGGDRVLHCRGLRRDNLPFEPSANHGCGAGGGGTEAFRRQIRVAVVCGGTDQCVAALGRDTAAGDFVQHLRRAGFRIGRRQAIFRGSGLLLAVHAFDRRGAAVVLIPHLPLLKFIIYSQVANGILLPFVLVYMLLLVNRPHLMGGLQEQAVAERGGVGNGGGHDHPDQSH